VPWWGIASLVMLIGQYTFGEYNFRLEDAGAQRLVSRTVHYELCTVIQAGAVIAGIVAIRRGSKWWLLTAIPAAILAFQCMLGEL